MSKGISILPQERILRNTTRALMRLSCASKVHLARPEPVKVAYEAGGLIPVYICRLIRCHRKSISTPPTEISCARNGEAGHYTPYPIWRRSFGTNIGQIRKSEC